MLTSFNSFHLVQIYKLFVALYYQFASCLVVNVTVFVANETENSVFLGD